MIFLVGASRDSESLNLGFFHSHSFTGQSCASSLPGVFYPAIVLATADYIFFFSFIKQQQVTAPSSACCLRNASCALITEGCFSPARA